MNSAAKKKNLRGGWGGGEGRERESPLSGGAVQRSRGGSTVVAAAKPWLLSRGLIKYAR